MVIKTKIKTLWGTIMKAEYNFDRGELKYRWLLLAIFGLVVLAVSWNSDDAFHAYVMARNLVEGNGFVYNAGYRVTATTCPLFTLIVALGYALFGHMSFIGIGFGVLFSTMAAYIIIFKLCPKMINAVLAVGIMLGSYCFMCYTTAGLENSLLFFLGALFFNYFFSHAQFTHKGLLYLAFLLSLVAMTRMDAVLIFIPAICIGYLIKTKAKWGTRFLCGLLGLLPFIAWEIFSVIYYGYPFPNTMYIKLNTGLEKADYIVKGFDFIYQSGMMDILLVMLPLFFIVLSIIKKNRDAILLAVGIVIYDIYVISIGGDFMLGRHLTVQFFLALIGLTYLGNQYEFIHEFKKCKVNLTQFLMTVCVIGLVFGSCVRPIVKEYLYDSTWDDTGTGVSDEKYHYYHYSGLIPYTYNLIANQKNMHIEMAWPEIEVIDSFRAAGDIGNYSWGVSGMTAYYEMDKGTMYLTDRYGLMDPLLSHLPAIKHEHWRVGHMVRLEPDGYPESIASGENLIENESLHEFYDKVLLIIAGDIWDPERLQTVWSMNMGQYDYLIEQYVGD